MKKTKRGGEKAERFFYEVLSEILPDLRPTANSGAVDGNGDLSTPFLLVDVKSTKGEGVPKLSGKDVDKIERQADRLGKDAIIPVLDSSGRAFVIFPLHLAKKALRALYVRDSKASLEGSREGWVQPDQGI